MRAFSSSPPRSRPLASGATAKRPYLRTNTYLTAAYLAAADSSAGIEAESVSVGGSRGDMTSTNAGVRVGRTAHKTVSSVKQLGSLSRSSSVPKQHKKLPSSALPKVPSLSNVANGRPLQFDEQNRPIIRPEDFRRSVWERALQLDTEGRLPLAKVDDPQNVDPIEAEFDKVFVEKPAMSRYSPEEQRKALEQLHQIMPNLERKKFFEKSIKLITKPEEVMEGEVFDRLIIGFGPQGLHHLHAVLHTWAKVGHEGHIAIIGDPKGSGAWNESSISNTQNSPPETEARKILIENFIVKHEDVLRNYFRSINNPAAEMSLDFVLQKDENIGLNGNNSPTIRYIYSSVVFEDLFRQMNEYMAKLGNKVTIKFFSAFAHDILLDADDDDRYEGETVCFRMTGHEDTSHKIVGEIVMLDTGTPFEPIKQRMGPRQASAVKEKYNLGDEDIAKINACLDERVYSGWMNETMGEQLAANGLLDDNGMLKPGIFDENGKRIGGPIIAIRGKKLSAYEAYICLNRYMRVLDYDENSRRYSVDPENAAKYQGSVVLYSRPETGIDYIHSDTKWCPPRIFCYLPLVSPETGEMETTSNPFFWPYGDVLPRGTEETLLAEALSEHGHAHFGDIAEEAKRAIQEAVMGRQRHLPYTESQAHDVKFFMTTYGKVRSLRSKASQLQREGGDMSVIRKLRERSNGLVGAILRTQQAVERAFGYMTTLCYVPVLNQDDMPLKTCEWDRVTFTSNAKRTENPLLDGLILTKLGKYFSYIPGAAHFRRVSQPVTKIVNGRPSSDEKRQLKYYPNRLQFKRLEHHNFYHLASSTIPSYFMASLSVELGIASDITSTYLEVDMDRYMSSEGKDIGWITKDNDGNELKIDFITAMPTFNSEQTELHRNVIARSANRNANFPGAPARPLVDNYLRRIINRHGKVTCVEDNSFLTTGVRDGDQNFVTQLFFDIINLDSAGVRAAERQNYTEPIDILARKVFVSYSVPKQIEYCHEIARVTSLSMLSEEVYHLATRSVEPFHAVGQVKDLGLWHIRELRERDLERAKGDPELESVAWAMFKKRVNVINQRRGGGLNAIILLTEPTSDGLGLTDAQKMYERGNNDLIPGSPQNPPEAKHSNFYFQPPATYHDLLKLQNRAGEEHLQRQINMLKLIDQGGMARRSSII